MAAQKMGQGADRPVTSPAQRPRRRLAQQMSFALTSIRCPCVSSGATTGEPRALLSTKVAQALRQRCMQARTAHPHVQPPKNSSQAPFPPLSSPGGVRRLVGLACEETYGVGHGFLKEERDRRCPGSAASSAVRWTRRQSKGWPLDWERAGCRDPGRLTPWNHRAA